MRPRLNHYPLPTAPQSHDHELGGRRRSAASRLVFAVLSALLLAGPAVGIRLPAAAAAGAWYIAPFGNDASTCAEIGAPCATINGAIAKAAPGDSVFVAQGTYTATVASSSVVSITKSLSLSGGWDAAFAFQVGTSTLSN